MPNPYVILGAVISAIVIAVSSYFFGSSVKNDEWLAKWNEREATLHRQYADSLEQSAERERVLQDALHIVDAQGTQELRKHEQEVNSLRADLDAGRKRLRIAATCPRQESLPGSPASSSVDNRTGAELDASARQDYLALRGGINRTETKLRACQSALASERVK